MALATLDTGKGEVAYSMVPSGKNLCVCVRAYVCLCLHACLRVCIYVVRARVYVFVCMCAHL